MCHYPSNSHIGIKPWPWRIRWCSTIFWGWMFITICGPLVLDVGWTWRAIRITETSCLWKWLTVGITETSWVWIHFRVLSDPCCETSLFLWTKPAPHHLFGWDWNDAAVPKIYGLKKMWMCLSPSSYSHRILLYVTWAACPKSGVSKIIPTESPLKLLRSKRLLPMMHGNDVLHLSLLSFVIPLNPMAQWFLALQFKARLKKVPGQRQILPAKKCCFPNCFFSRLQNLLFWRNHKVWRDWPPFRQIKSLAK
jgi:hypothetical protein